MLLRIGIAFVRRSRVLDESRATQVKRTGGRQPSGTAVAVAVDVALHSYVGADADLIGLAQIPHTRGMHKQHSDHGHGLRDLELNVVAQTYEHGRSFPDLSSRQGSEGGEVRLTSIITHRAP